VEEATTIGEAYIIEKLPETPLETAAKYVREDSDSH